MVPQPTDMTLIFIASRQRDLRPRSDRHRVYAIQPATPGLLQRFAFRLAGWSRRPAMVAGRPVQVASALELSAL
jgi:hypothetical protein